MIIPNATAFPNHVDDGYKGMLVVPVKLKVCVPSPTCSGCSIYWYYCG